ncbi:hypothetical protein CC1G_12188 [Coprinopsis cinerea okayama7|uniref:Ubiquitin 3 binding protein But2 C-terminal domain-containing protein n=1 Tax=Coprinopsis cinerea (strain Okayama-7 / 130 / ATCC MYA-4618 / FGSC 9003) TaxID=240176 RepID=A8N0X8_COPC7|nr:hypothetical protein CC1G_12188 [Coprinopsis cinerea okayama7\|eukprot:XP_001828527.2 hypothetical protein CC1G_12188 [Coprinopsis cinerea okayama7\
MAGVGLRFYQYLAFLSVLKLLSIALAAPNLQTQSTEDDVNIAPLGVNVTVVTTFGPGCSPAWHEMDPQTKAVTVHLPDTQIEFGPGIHPNSSRMHCRVDFLIQKPQDWTYGIQSIDVTGYFKLDEGVRAFFLGDYYFPSDPWSVVNEDFDGPFSHSLYTYSVKFPLWRSTLASCSPSEASRITTQTSIRLRDIDAGNSTGGSGSVGIPHHLDDGLTLTYQFGWVKCLG